jgi:glycosyltransferase involved in cell wall biosynthesis
MRVNDLLEFVGPVRYDLLPSYIGRNVLILPSITTENWKEQFGMVLTEAMAMGRVVIGSNSGAIPDVIGDAGIIVEEKSSSAIALVLKELWHNPSLVKTYSQKGLKRVKETYSPEVVVNKYIKLLVSDKP